MSEITNLQRRVETGRADIERAQVIVQKASDDDERTRGRRYLTHMVEVLAAREQNLARLVEVEEEFTAARAAKTSAESAVQRATMAWSNGSTAPAEALALENALIVARAAYRAGDIRYRDAEAARMGAAASSAENAERAAEQLARDVIGQIVSEHRKRQPVLTIRELHPNLPSYARELARVIRDERTCAYLIRFECDALDAADGFETRAGQRTQDEVRDDLRELFRACRLQVESNLAGSRELAAFAATKRELAELKNQHGRCVDIGAARRQPKRAADRVEPAQV